MPSTAKVMYAHRAPRAARIPSTRNPTNTSIFMRASMRLAKKIKNVDNHSLSFLNHAPNVRVDLTTTMIDTKWRPFDAEAISLTDAGNRQLME